MRRPARPALPAALLAAALAACAPQAPAAKEPAPMNTAALLGEEWRCTEIAGTAVTGERPPTIAFAEGGQANGFTAVNRFMGSWTREGNSFRITPSAVTKMAGPPEAMRREQEFLRVLRTVDACVGDARRLELRAGGTVVLRLER